MLAISSEAWKCSKISSLWKHHLKQLATSLKSKNMVFQRLSLPSSAGWIWSDCQVQTIYILKMVKISSTSQVHSIILYTDLVSECTIVRIWWWWSVNYTGWKQLLRTMSSWKFSGFLGSECSDCGPEHCDTVSEHQCLWRTFFHLSGSMRPEWGCSQDIQAQCMEGGHSGGDGVQSG
jgi:hypothetical protein